MIRTLKTLGLTLAAACALSAVTATAASAESFAFHSEVEHTNLAGAGAGTHQFTVDAGTATCKASFAGTMSSQEATGIGLSPAYTECTADPAGTAQVVMNGCQYVLTAATKESSIYEAELDLACAEGKTVEVKVIVSGVTKCTIHIPPQALDGVTVSEASEGDLKVVAEAEGIEYDQTAGTGIGACSKAENTTNGTYKGEVVLAGSLGEVQVNMAMQALTPILLAATPIKFNGKDDEQVIKIENKSGKDLTKGLKYQIAPGAGNEFLLAEDTCDKGIAKDKSCQVKLKCKTASGKTAYLIVETQAPDPHGVTASKLEGC